MIRTIYAGVGWQVGPLPESETARNGFQIDLMDPPQVVHIPWQGPKDGDDVAVDLLKACIEKLSDDQKRALLPSITGGIQLPGRDFDSTSLRGPQG